MKILIVEDEKLAADNLEKLIVLAEPTVQILAKLESVRDTVKWLTANTADLIFLDIQLSDGISFKIFELVKVSIPVIFTTAYDQYAIRAFKVNSVDYLLKPIGQEDVAKALEKYKRVFQTAVVPDFQQLLSSIKNTVNYQNRIIVYVGDKIKSLKTEEVAYFYIREKGTFLCTFDNRHYDVDYTLDRLEEILDPSLFFRINRQFIVNIEAIENMHMVSKSRIKVELKPKPDDDAIVSYNNMQEFKQWLNR
jgi:two-component system, LytTR family, response regulator LytT